VSQNHHALISRISQTLAVLGLLVLSTVPASAQHTVVEKNGVSGRIETDYNAAGKAIEMRTIAADGRVEQKVNYQYLPGYYVAQKTDITYWPNGRVRRVARNTYDQSANFTGEFLQMFDETGKQIGGHKLTHDPWTGVYRCSEWNAGAQDYRAIECPAGEEERGAEEESKTFTYDEVMKNLVAARANAVREQKVSHTAETQAHAHSNTAPQVVGLVLPAHVRPGERVSGTVVENPDQYSEMPEVSVTRVVVPFEPDGEASRLSGWWFETRGEEPQRAGGPITLVVPAREAKATFREAGNPSHSVSLTLNFPALSQSKPPSPKSFQAPALCMKDELCAVSGAFNGDSTKTFAAFQDRPAKILAESSDAAYLEVPQLIEPGSRPLFIAEGTKVVALPVAVGRFLIKNNGRALQAGENLIAFPTLEGPEDIPDATWQIAGVPTASLQRAQRLIAGFQLSQADREEREELGDHEKKESAEKRESEEKKGQGEILLVIQNHTPEQVSLRASRNEMLVFHLAAEAFRRGEFKYDLVIEAKKAGKVDVKGYVIPFLAPTPGQEFDGQRPGW
jgi:hypothetical protein